MIALAVTTHTAAAAPDDDLLEQAKQRQQVAIQKAEQEVRQADALAAQVGKNDPARAIEILKSAIVAVEANEEVPEAKRASLKRALGLTVRAFVGRLQGLTRTTPIAPAVVDARRLQEERERQDNAALARAMQEIQALRASGRSIEANRMQEDLRSRYPSTPALAAGSIIAGRNDYLADSRRIADQKNTGYLGVNREIDKAAIPEPRDYVLPPDWVEKSKKRSLSAQLTETEKGILRALNTQTSADLDGKSFDDVIKWIETAMGKPVVIIVPPVVLQEAQVTSDTTVKAKFDRVTFRTVLKKVLAEVGLIYVIKDQVIQVTTAARAREMLTTRSYYVGDLVSVVDVRFGPIQNQFQMIDNVNRVMAMVVQSIDPTAWEANGGLGRISFDPITMSIVVRQTAEVHMMLGVGLR